MRAKCNWHSEAGPSDASLTVAVKTSCWAIGNVCVDVYKLCAYVYVYVFRNRKIYREIEIDMDTNTAIGLDLGIQVF